MKNSYKRKYIKTAKKAKPVVSGLPERKCLGSRLLEDCNRMFMPSDRFNFLCELCNTYAVKNNTGE